MMNWKTTVIGAVGAVLMVVIPMLQGGVFDWKTLVPAAVTALLGWFAKDHNVTGGTITQ